VAETTPRDLAALLSAVAHDFRTPLATIYGFAKTIERGGALGQRDARFLGLVMEAAQDLDRQLGHLSSIARVVDGRTKPVLADVPTQALVTAAVERAEPTSDGRGVQAADGAGGTVRTDIDLAASALALLAEAAVRLEPSTPAAELVPEPDGASVRPVSATLAPLLVAIGRDVPLAAAQFGLIGLRAGVKAGDGFVRVVFPTA
jgi:K+-sensing histidine kinase KdpD